MWVKIIRSTDRLTVGQIKELTPKRAKHLIRKGVAEMVQPPIETPTRRHYATRSRS